MTAIGAAEAKQLKISNTSMTRANRSRRGCRDSEETRKQVRLYYRRCLSVALAGVTLVALWAGEKTIADTAYNARQASAEASTVRRASRELLASHGEMKVTPACAKADMEIYKKLLETDPTKMEAPRAVCCAQPPATKDALAPWKDVCKDTLYLSGDPYIACLDKWYEVGVKCAADGNDVDALCSLKSHCSDTGVYQKFGLNIGTVGFHPAMNILYLMFLLYVFMGLAVVCDEYFVPAIDEIAEVWNITPDVAGATLMAAGGSAPELATSFMGVFVSKSDVGFSTIVGSAVPASFLTVFLT